MSDTAPVRRNGDARLLEPLRSLGWLDWVFVFLSWFSCAYLCYIVMELSNPRQTVGFDYMVIVTAVPTIIIAWRGLRLREQLKDALARLNDGAALILADESSMSEFRDDMDRSVRRWSIIWALVISATLLGIMVVQVVWEKWEINAQIILLTVVMGLAGALIGYLLGRLAGFATLFKVMDKHKIQLAGLSTPAARMAMSSLENVFRFSTLATTLLCHWFAGWRIAWLLGLPHYLEWKAPFLVLWGVSFTLYMLTARSPALGFQRRLDTLYGSAAGRERIDRNLAEAEKELAEVRSSPPAQNRRARTEILELERYVTHLRDLRFRSRLLTPVLLNSLMVWNFLIMAVPLIIEWALKE